MCSIGRVRSCVRPVCAAVKPLAIMLCADRVKIVSAHFKSAMTQTGSADPRIDLVCITSSCPRQFLQNFRTPSSLPGLTSLNRSGFDATSLWHFDAAEQAPSTASDPALLRCLLDVRFSPEGGRTADIARSRKGANSGREQMQQHRDYSITSSARASRVGGTVRPSALAVVRSPQDRGQRTTPSSGLT